ncbi:LuxR C-terminal-related transcriptional regulator [Streptomyces sp. NPDC056632]|uniref:helix-turn-helix transcriptional regulator n=1 Tax=Streptomyces sp. NPDC056632 TaxID=3345884 RepID=UPI0036C87788
MYSPEAGTDPRANDIAILAGLARGRTYAQIGNDLGLPRETVRARIHSLCRRIGACSSAHAVAIAYEEGWMGGLRREPRPDVVLSERQRLILRCVAQGMTNSQIALRVGLHLTTITQCLSSVYTRLNARHRAHAVALAIQHRHITALERAGTEA